MVAVSSGVATCTVALAAGSHSIVATYSGASSFALSTSATLTQTVNPAVTATQSIASKALTQNNATGSFTPVTGGGGTLPLFLRHQSIAAHRLEPQPRNGRDHWKSFCHVFCHHLYGDSNRCE